jgi:hypothetical protein
MSNIKVFLIKMLGSILENNMKKIFSMCLALAMLVSNHVWAAGLKTNNIVGDYSNIVTSMPHDPHQTGYAVTIYKRKDGLLYGKFTYAPGAIEAFSGKLFDLHVDGNKVEFKAKTSAGEIHSWMRNDPSRELFKFKGVMRKTALVGTLTLWDGYDLNKPDSVERVVLKRQKEFTPLSYEDYQYLYDKDAW